jgi:hypothetical protein
MESLIAKIQQEAASASYVGRKKLLDTLRDLQYSIETPEDAMQRVIHMVYFPSLRSYPELLDLQRTSTSPVDFRVCPLP